MNDMYIRIEELCRENGVNVTKMCKDTDIPRGNLTDLKMGRTEALSTKTLAKISSYFNVPMDYLLSGNSSGNMAGAIVSGSSIVIGDGKNIQSTVYNTGKEAELSSLEAGILDKVRKLSLEDQVKVFNFIMELNVQN